MSRKSPPKLPVTDRLASKVAINILSGCWEWTGCKDADGYGYDPQREDREQPRLYRLWSVHVRRFWMGAAMTDYRAMKDLRKSLDASALLVQCEMIAASGYLPGRQEEQLRMLIADVRAAFGPDIPERELPADNVVQLRPESEFIRALNAVAQEMS